MDNNELVRKINSVGKQVFVEQFELFRKYADGQIPRDHAVDALVEKGISNESGAAIRAGNAKQIFAAHMEEKALDIILDSSRLSASVISVAKRLKSEIDHHSTSCSPISYRNVAPTLNVRSDEAVIIPSKDFIFSDISNSIERDMAFILGKITHHVHPEIVNYIVQKNIKYKGRFKEICHHSCKVDSFFYPESDCVFPGYRRPINKEKTRGWKNKINDVDGTILNDNTFPRHVWAYLSVNKAYSGGTSGTWSSSGLSKFELAHVFGHKQDERGLEKKVFIEFEDKAEPYGLFTSASNVVLIPRGFAKPTDHMESIKVCYYKRHIDLYGNNIIGLNNLNEKYVPAWYEDIKWFEPLLPVDWKRKIDKLIIYRESHLEKKYNRKLEDNGI